MLKCNSKKIGFVHIPKTGGTSITRALFDLADPGQVKGFDGDSILIDKGWNSHVPINERQRQRARNLHVFSVVRNPWARYVSGYRRKTFLGHSQYNCSFGEWVERMEEYNINHWSDQCHYILGSKGLLVDSILRYETLNDEFLELSNRFKLGVQLPQYRYKSAGHYDYRDYYDDTILASIDRRVRRDADRFGYQFGDAV